MDLFLISYLPKLMTLGDSLLVRGPISKTLSLCIILFQEELIRSKMYPFTMVDLFFEETKRVDPNPYLTDGILRVAKVYLKNESLDESLEEAFRCYS
jgi:hypothetical protein